MGILVDLLDTRKFKKKMIFKGLSADDILTCKYCNEVITSGRAYSITEFEMSEFLKIVDAKHFNYRLANTDNSDYHQQQQVGYFIHKECFHKSAGEKYAPPK